MHTPSTNIRISRDVLARFRASHHHQGCSDSVALSLLLDKMEEYNRIDTRLLAIERKLDGASLHADTPEIEYAETMNIDWSQVG